MPVLGLIRQPLNVALTVAEGALDASLAVVRAARGFIEEDVAETRWSVSDPPPAEPAPPVPAGDSHVSEEPVPVAAFAEAGVENGAGAELNIAEPWEGYSRQDARTIVRRLVNAGRETLAAVELFENTHKRRRSVSAEADRRLKALSGQAAPRTR
jgi:hypothetical protein